MADTYEQEKGTQNEFYFIGILTFDFPVSMTDK